MKQIRNLQAKFINTRMTSCSCSRHIGRTQHTEIPTKPNQTETFVEICLYVYHIVVFEFNSFTEVHVDISIIVKYIDMITTQENCE